jgi:hypothetical protein
VRRALLLALALVSAPASALSIAAMRPHNPILSRPALDKLIAAIDSNDPARLDVLPFIYTDALGQVDIEEEAAFIEAMNTSDGRKDRDPIKVVEFELLVRDKFYPVYLVTLERQVWKLKEIEMDGCANITEHDRPHWETSRTTWLAAFRSNNIASFRQADELAFAAR